MRDPLSAVVTRPALIPQSQPASPRQVPNNAGGYGFALTDEQRLRQFLLLGTAGGTYYVGERELTADNAAIVMRAAAAAPLQLVATIVDVSVSGAAPKPNPALFALAVAASCDSPAGRAAALDALPTVARTGSHLFLFARYVEQFRGWGRGLRRAVARWYLTKSVDDLAYQLVKYRQREGWSNRDLLRLSHPITAEPARRGLFDWAAGREPDGTYALPRLLEGYLDVQAGLVDPATVVQSHGLPWEALPDSALGRRDVWEALLDRGLPQTALIRQLPRLTRLGLLDPLGRGSRTQQVCAQLADPDRLRKARVHPINLLVALRTYASGFSARGSGTWQPVAPVVDALDRAFYAAFGAVQPTGKRTCLALDVSGSMTWHPLGDLVITPREASAAIALVTAAVEPVHEIVGFTAGGRQLDAGCTSLSISPRQRLDDVIRYIESQPMGATDCAAPILRALRRRLEVDTFVVYTDGETWAGDVHPHVALEQYRQAMGIPAKLVVVGMEATGLSIADPADPGMLDVVGFDPAVPNLIAEFSRG